MTRVEMLQAFAAGKVSEQEMLTFLDALGQKSLYCKVSEKGGLSVYRLNKQFPITLYIDQWERLIAFIPELVAFAKENAGKFKRKADVQEVRIADQTVETVQAQHVSKGKKTLAQKVA